MDIATRFQPRVRAQEYLDRERSALPDDSGGESSETTNARRKFQRTATDSDATFRKPALPASATRPVPAPAPPPAPAWEHRPSLSQRRRSTLRETVTQHRLPSGPREYPGVSPGKRMGNSTTITAAAPSDLPIHRSFLPTHGPSNAYLTRNTIGNRTTGPEASRLSFGQHPTSTDDADSPPTPPTDLLPTMNFDDFQNSITDPNWVSPLLREFPAVSGGRALPKDNPNMAGVVAKSDGLTRPGALRQQEVGDREGLGRSASLRRKLSVAPTTRPQGLPSPTTTASSASQQTNASTNMSVRTRRQSTMPQPARSNPAPTSVAPPSALAAGGGANGRPPRKSIGPGLITAMMDSAGNRKTSGQQQIPILASAADSALKPALARTGSIKTTSRRTTIQPSALITTTQSRANKVKSLLPSPRSEAHQQDPNPPHERPVSKGNPSSNAHHAPSNGSGGNSKRQSTISGRASGLGARTISPTDARRLKRMSTMQAPPLPTHYMLGTSPSTPQDEPFDPFARPELPRLAQPSPSLIPLRKSDSTTPNSARTSPEGRLHWGFPSGGGGGGGVSLSRKSSHQSLNNNNNNANNSGGSNSSSRLPTPKPRNMGGAAGGQSSSALGHYGNTADDRELVPPVPAIPKAYESPKDHDQLSFSSSLKSSHSLAFGIYIDHATMPGEFDFDGMGALLPPPPPTTVAPTPPRTSMDVLRTSPGSPRKRSGELPSNCKRTFTVGTGPHAAPRTSGAAAPQQQQQQACASEATGRKNSNLQPLRLPPLNLMPLNSTRQAQKIASSLPRPSQELDGSRTGMDECMMSVQTPEPKRNAKTPSTPMTASKATFWGGRSRAQEESSAYQKALRSSSSHHALRDVVMQMDDGGATRFFDDSGDDMETAAAGVPIPKPRQQQQSSRAAMITPFSSGSLPRVSGEFARSLRGRPSGEYIVGQQMDHYRDEYDLGGYGADLQLHPREARQIGGVVRPKTSGVLSSTTAMYAQAETVADSSPIAEAAREMKDQKDEKKEAAGGGLRRKLSLGWRRSSSKAANHAEKESSPQQAQQGQQGEAEKGGASSHSLGGVKSTKRSNEMPPPKLPASATWQAGEGATVARPSLDSIGARRKSTMRAQAGGMSNGTHHHPAAGAGGEGESMSTSGVGATGGVKTRSLHSEQPQPVPLSAAHRASSWGSTNALSGRNQQSQTPPSAQATVKPRHKLTGSTISAIVKDKDDLLADDEMRRLSQKRRDVDTAARETDQLRARAMARSPMSPEQVLHGLFGRDKDALAELNIYERGEITEFAGQGVYFTGTRAARKVCGNLSPVNSHAASDAKDGLSSKESKNGGGGNYGYDDERGDYNIVIGDHLAYRYEVVDILGKGSFGQVVRCVDHKEGGVVAVKIIRNKKRFHQQALVEVEILGRLGEWDPDGAYATLSITSSFYFRSHLCIVTPCLSINLYELIRAHNFTGFPLVLIRRFARQLLACLTLLQTKRIIHCDLKPENILLCEARKADVRVIDFGSSCREDEKVYTYIQSRFYRSPEVILGSTYGMGIDMWSLGCILAELWTGYPLFPGENEQEQLACIMEIFGPPDRHLVERCTRKKLFFDSVGKPRVTVSSKGRRRRPSSKTLAQALKTEDEAFVDFIARCLRWDPERRMKPNEAIAHPFVTGLPFHQRPGIPEEARRAARVRSSAAVPTATMTSAVNGAPASSPTKGRNPTKEGNAFAQQAANSTPTGKERNQRPLPDTPQTAVRNPTTNAPANVGLNGSPRKPPADPTRRHSTVLATAGSKRASNGAVLSAAAAVPGPQRQESSGSVATTTSLAQMAARESMSASTATAASTANASAAGRWRT